MTRAKEALLMLTVSVPFALMAYSLAPDNLVVNINQPRAACVAYYDYRASNLGLGDSETRTDDQIQVARAFAQEVFLGSLQYCQGDGGVQDQIRLVMQAHEAMEENGLHSSGIGVSNDVIRQTTIAALARFVDEAGIAEALKNHNHERWQDVIPDFYGFVLAIKPSDAEIGQLGLDPALVRKPMELWMKRP